MLGLVAAVHGEVVVLNKDTAPGLRTQFSPFLKVFAEMELHIRKFCEIEPSGNHCG